MATELNFTARLDTSQFLSQVDQARTHFGLVFGGGGGAGMNDVSGGVSQAFQQMFTTGSAFQPQPGGGFGQLFGAQQLYNPNYGAVEASTTLGQEWAVHRGGLAVADRFRPPGVSSVDYALGVEKNFINRQLEATHAANMAGQSAFFSGVAGLAGGEIASMVATPIGAMAGGAIASRLLGPGAAGAGALVGGIAAGWLAYDKASEFIGERVQRHFAKIEEVSNYTTELGELAGAGRNLNRSQRLELGIAARKASKDIGMDVNEMGDILALGREAGMLPSSTDPSKAREQYREFARAIEEGAQIIGGSLAQATAVIKSGAASGMGAQEAIVRAAGAGGYEGFMQQQAMAALGASMGRSMGYTGAQGSGVLMGAMAGVGHAGMSYEEMQILGGRAAAGQFVASTQMAMAKSPLGNMQLMAAMGGGGMGGMGLMDLPGAALAGLGAGGGDFMSNAGSFMVHQNELRRGIGSAGIQTMARSQLQMGGEMIGMFMPDLSANEAQRLYAQSMGLDPDQAKVLVGSQGGRGGGIDAASRMRAVEALQGTMISSVARPGPARSPSSFGMGYAIEGAVIGGTVGNIPGAIIGGIGGFIAGNVGAIGDALDGPSLFASATEKADYWSRRQAQEYDAAMDSAKRRYGVIDINKAAGERFLTGNMTSARLDMDAAGNPVASSRTAAVMRAMGLQPVHAGAGTIKVDGEFFSATAVKRVAAGRMWQAGISEHDHLETLDAAVAATHGPGVDQKQAAQAIQEFKRNYETVRLGATPMAHGYHNALQLEIHDKKLSEEGFEADMDISVTEAGKALLPSARKLAEMIPTAGEHGKVRARVLQKLKNEEGLYDPWVASVLESETGFKMRDMMPAAMAGRAGAAGLSSGEAAVAAREAYFLRAMAPGGQVDPRLRGTAEDLRNMGFVPGGDAIEVVAARRLPSAYYKAVQENTHYIAAKEHILNNRLDAAKKEGQIAFTEELARGGAAYAGITVPVFNPTKNSGRPDAGEYKAARQKELDAQVGIAVDLRNAGLTAASDAAFAGAATQAKVFREEHEKMVKESMTLVDNVRQEHHDVGTRPKQRRPGPATIERAVGFGEQESAMQSILKSLRSTENSLATLDKKIAEIKAKPQPSADVKP